MKSVLKTPFKLALMSLSALSLVNFAACDVDKTKEGELPDVDVNVKGGKLPAYDVDTADVDVKMKDKKINVPDVDVKMKETEVRVPDVDVNMPDDKDGKDDQF